MKTITLQFFTCALALTLMLGSLTIVPMTANAHDGEDHGDDAIEQREALLELLQQLLALLMESAELQGIHVDVQMDDHMHMDSDHADVLTISVEVHDGRTHIHVNEPGKDEVKFFLDGIEVTDHEAVITAVAEETGFTGAEVETAATFPSDEESHDHDAMMDEHDEDETDLDGIHIMHDGTVMLGNGEVLEDATVTDDGMIMLADGDLVEPEFDLR